MDKDNNISVEDFTHTWPGKYYTLNIPGKLRPTEDTQLYLELHKELNYLIFIHDPNYFFFTATPTFPLLMYEVKPNVTPSHYWRIRLTEVEELDHPLHPCNTDPDFNFQACVRESLSRQVGCRTKWDRWSPQDIPLCHTLEQYR